MILSLIRSLNHGTPLAEVIPGILFTIIVVVFSLSLHETAHGYAAYKMGDPTARNLGRLSLNPARHLDPIGTIAMMLVGFGWAKPVPINSRYFRNPRKGIAITSLSGPVSNLLLSFVALLLQMILNAALDVHLFSVYGSTHTYISVMGSDITTLGDAELFAKIIYFISLLLSYFHILNLYLAIFNLIPIPPLDGSKILYLFLPSRIYYRIQQYEQYISIVLIVLLLTGSLSGILSDAAYAVSDGMAWLIDLIPGL